MNSVVCILTVNNTRHQDDLVGFVLRGNGGGDKFKWLNFPAIVTKETGSKEWYDKMIRKHMYTHADPFIYDLKREEEESSLWEVRKGLQTLKDLEKADPYTFQSQYMNDPTAKGVGIINEDWWKEYDKDDLDLSTIKRTFMVADTASTTKSYSDYSVVMYMGVTEDNDLLMLDAIVGKWETPELMNEMHKFWNKHNKLNLSYPRMLPRAMYVEDKSSGHYIIQQVMRTGSIRMLPIPRDKTQGDKLARFLNTVPYFAQGRVLLPSRHKHLDHIRREVLGFTSLGSGTGNDDCVDTISDSVAIAFSQPTANYTSWI